VDDHDQRPNIQGLLGSETIPLYLERASAHCPTIVSCFAYWNAKLPRWIAIGIRRRGKIARKCIPSNLQENAFHHEQARLTSFVFKAPLCNVEIVLSRFSCHASVVEHTRSAYARTPVVNNKSSPAALSIEQLREYDLPIRAKMLKQEVHQI